MDSVTKKRGFATAIPKSLWISGVIVFILLVVALLQLVNFFKSDQVAPSSVNVISGQVIKEGDASQKQIRERRIDGVLVQEEVDTNHPIISVMIENHTQARPQSGLSKANLVIEAPVEGGITRHLAFFDLSTEIEAIGPVRSARPYYLDWAQSMASIYAHVGGSPEALRNIKTYGFFDLDQFYQSQYFWRSQDRVAPHNVYTSSTLLKRALEDKKITKAKEFTSWKYKDERLKGQEAVNTFAIHYSEDVHKVSWTYDQQSNRYKRNINGGVDKDRNGGEYIEASNVIVADYPILIIDQEGRRRIDILGEGEAKIFLDGTVIKGTWKQENKDTRMRFYDAHGEEIALNRGMTWIHVVDFMDRLKM